MTTVDSRTPWEVESSEWLDAERHAEMVDEAWEAIFDYFDVDDTEDRDDLRHSMQAAGMVIRLTT